MNKGFIKLSLLFVGLLSLVGLVGYLVSANKVGATIHLEDWSCQSNGPQCGTNDGTEKVCPKGYERWGNTCRDWVDAVYTCGDLTESIHGTNYNVAEFYNKNTGDDHHCHRIVWGDLSEDSEDNFKDMHHNDYDYSTPNHGNWTSAYNTHIDQNPSADIVDGTNKWVYAEPVTQKCVAGEPRYDSCEEEGTCPTECGYEGGTVPDGKGGTKTCEATKACEIDQCINLEGFQATLPDGMKNDEKFFCTCKEGYHEVIEENGLKRIVIVDGYSNFTCEPDEVTPTPTPTEPPREESRGFSPAGAPQCTDHTPVVLPSNPHVIRSGSEATVNFFTQSSNANIYFKEVNATEWQHALRDIPVTNGYVSVTIHDLNPALGYTFGIQAANSCAGGEVVLAVIVDGPESVTFGFSYWEWLK